MIFPVPRVKGPRERDFSKIQVSDKNNSSCKTAGIRQINKMTRIAVIMKRKFEVFKVSGMRKKCFRISIFGSIL